MTERPLAVSAAELHLHGPGESANAMSYNEANGDYEHANGFEHTNGNGNLPDEQDIPWPIERRAEDVDWTPGNGTAGQELSGDPATSTLLLYEELLPGHRRSLSAISVHCFLLGVTLGSCVVVALSTGLSLPATQPPQAWRVFFLLSALSVFHFLEFWTHARFNVPKATVSAFILFNNGWQYTAANTLSLIETTVTSYCFPRWQAKFANFPLQAVAFIVMLVGQVCRSTAMAQAGTNFNHKVQTKRSHDHTLVTSGIYSWLRHPSYFGFFWWAVALQVVLGNAICFWVYLIILWNFFRQRIAHEEAHLVTFFGDEYRKYKARTRVGIPFIN